MIPIIAKEGEAIRLGVQGEQARCVVFSCTQSWLEFLPSGGVFSVVFQPPDNAAYACNVIFRDGVVVWEITSTETAKAGDGWVELQYRVEDYVAKHYRWLVTIDETLSTPGPAPDPWQSWVDDVLEASAIAQTSATAAQGSAEDAEESANAASQSAQSASQSADAADESATEAAQSAADAESAKDAAKDSEDAAKASEEAAVLSEQNAAISEENALEYKMAAESAQASAETAATNASQSADAAAASEQNAGASAEEASGYELAAESAKDAAEAAKTAAETAQEAAETAKDNAVSAKTAAEEAQAEAEAAEDNAKGYAEDIEDLTVSSEHSQDATPDVEKTGGGDTPYNLHFILRDGYSPSITVTDLPNGHRVTITDSEGAHSFDVMDGIDVTHRPKSEELIRLIGILAAEYVSIEDEGGHFESSDAEGALQEIGARFNEDENTTESIDADLQAHKSNKQNPHEVTWAQVVERAVKTDQIPVPLAHDAETAEHITDRDNPHEVKWNQIGGSAAFMIQALLTAPKSNQGGFSLRLVESQPESESDGRLGDVYFGESAMYIHNGDTWKQINYTDIGG